MHNQQQLPKLAASAHSKDNSDRKKSLKKKSKLHH